MRLFVLTPLFAATVIAACGTGKPSGFDEGSKASQEGGSGLGNDNGSGLSFDAGTPVDADPYKNDPLPPWCGADGGPVPPPPPGGTLECPDDKNKEGCPCTTAGQTAACWPGLRVNRHLGMCKDGTTTCTHRNETSNTWGPCVGAVLPQAGATKGKAACKCFSAGQWKLSNLSPCFITYNGTTTYGVSTVLDTGGQAQCPEPPATPPPPLPPSIWSTDTLNVDCAGHFKLCYELKAGDFANAKPTDCSLAKVCVEGDYLKENVEQPFPDLAPWTSPDTACAAQFASTGGYGEMTVIGQSVLCDKVDDGSGNPLVFNRVQYCKQECMQNPNAPGCPPNCQQGGSGQF